MRRGGWQATSLFSLKSAKPIPSLPRARNEPAQPRSQTLRGNHDKRTNCRTRPAQILEPKQGSIAAECLLTSNCIESYRSCKVALAVYLGCKRRHSKRNHSGGRSSKWMTRFRGSRGKRQSNAGGRSGGWRPPVGRGKKMLGGGGWERGRHGR